ncbi:MAG: polymer-forming cytoskeletal protein, partial [Synergistaceae bacterium]
MSYKDNFKTAIYEVFGVGEKPEPEEKSLMPQTSSETPKSQPVQAASEEKVIIPMRRKAERTQQEECSVISKDTTVVGQIVSSGHVLMMGRVEGDLTAEGNVSVSGVIKGNIKGSNVELKSCSVLGDVYSTGIIEIDSGTEVIGCLGGEAVTVDGRLKGDIASNTDVYFKKSAFVIGNVVAK